MVVLKPFNYIYFIDDHGNVALKGLLVTKSCCPTISKLRRDVVYVAFTSTIEEDETKHFIHLYTFRCIKELVKDNQLGNITTIDIVASRHNPWTPFPNETRQKYRVRKKRLTKQLYVIMWDYVMKHSERHLCCRCCLSGIYHHPLLWRNMVMNGKLGLITSGVKLMNDPVDATHVFNNDLFDDVCQALHLR